MEIGKNNRIEQTPIHDLNLPANPHGYWLFGSLDFQSGNMISSRARYDHFDTSPYSIGLSLTAYSFYHGIVYLTSPFGKNFLTCEIGIKYLACLCNGLSIGAPDFKFTDSGQSHGDTFAAIGHLAVQRALARHVEGVCAGQR